MQNYTGLYRKSMHRDRSPKKIRRCCNPRAEAKHVHPNRVTSRNWTASRNWSSSHVTWKCEKRVKPIQKYKGTMGASSVEHRTSWAYHSL